MKQLIALLALLPLLATAQVPLDSLVKPGDTIVLSADGKQTQFVLVATKRFVAVPTTPAALVPADSLFAGLTPAIKSERDNTLGMSVGLVFSVSAASKVIGARFYAAAAGTHKVTLNGVSKTITAAVGWNRLLFDSPISLDIGSYTISVYSAPGYYANTVSGITGQKAGVLTAVRGVYDYGDVTPKSTWNNSNYFITPITGK